MQPTLPGGHKSDAGLGKEVRGEGALLLTNLDRKKKRQGSNPGAKREDLPILILRAEGQN